MKLTLLSERATSFSLMVITALLHLPGRSSATRTTNKRRAGEETGSQIPFLSFLYFFFFTRTQRTENARDDAHHLKKNRLTSTENWHDREEYLSFFVMLLYVTYV